MPDPTLRLKYYQETGQTDLAKQYEQYLRETGQMSADDDGPKPGLATKILGTLAATGRDIPGVEAAQAFTRSAVRTGLHKILPESIAPDAESYREARDNIRGGEDAAPAVARNIARIGGGGLSALAIPGGAVRSGFLYGAADALGSSDPDTDIKGRIDNAGVEGAMYGGLGALGSTANAVRRLPPGSLGKVGKAMLPAFVKRGIGAVEAIRGAAAPVAEAAIPQAEGFVGNGMDNVLEAVKANGSEAPASDVLQAVKNGSGQSRPPILAPTRHRTNAQFDHFAEQFARRQAEQQATAAEPSIEDLLAQSLSHVKRGGSLSSLRPPTP